MAHGSNVVAGSVLPSGTVTFLFTDIEGSTRLWETESAAMSRSLLLHNERLYATFEHHGGVPFSTMGDGMAVAFPSAVGAVRAALLAQRGLMAADAIRIEGPDRAPVGCTQRSNAWSVIMR